MVFQGLSRAALALMGFATLCVVMVSDVAYRKLLQDAILWLANLKIGGQLHLPSVHPFSRLKAVNNAILHWMESAKTWAEGFVVHQLLALTEVAALLVGVPLAIALTLWLAIDAIWSKLDDAFGGTHVTKITNRITQSVTVVKKVATARIKALEHDVAVLKSRVAHSVAVGVGAVAMPFPRIGNLERTVKAQGRALRRLGKRTLAPAAIVAAALAVPKLGLGWLRCRNVKRTGKAICGLDADTLTALLAGTLILTEQISLAALARELQGPTRLVESAMRTLIVERGAPPPPRSGGV